MKKRIWFANLPVDCVGLGSISSVLVGLAKRRRKNPFLVTYLNAHHFNLAQKSKEYYQILKRTDLVYADGWGIVLAVRLFGYKLPGRLTACDFFFDFCHLCQKEKISLFLLGGEKGIAQKTVKVLKKEFPHLRIKGWANGFFNKKEEKKLIKRINSARPDFLIVNMGAPRQEIWLDQNLPRLKVKVGWAVGGLFNYLAGRTPRVPYWIGKAGFEWLFRLLAEPKRLWQRYLIGLPLFALRVLKLRLKEVL